MRLKALVDEDFVNYKKPSMFIAFPTCSWKCEKECGERVCQNGTLASSPDIEVEPQTIVDRYMDNPLTHAVVVGGLEPFDSPVDLLMLVLTFRKYTDDDIVIYTGYTKDELKFFDVFEKLIYCYPNIIIKFGRYIPNKPHRHDEVLGVELASDNQYAEKYNTNNKDEQTI